MKKIREHKILMNDKTRKLLLKALDMAYWEGALLDYQYEYFVKKLGLVTNENSNTNN